MPDKRDHPNIKPGGRIKGGQWPCIVSMVYEDEYSPAGEVVFNPERPTRNDAEWDDEQWAFAETGDYGGFAEKSPRLAEYVRMLKVGR
jgi:hypothetical protein